MKASPMDFTSLDDLTKRAPQLGAAPLLVILCEDGFEIEGTIRHHLDAGFPAILLALPPRVAAPGPLPETVHRLTLPARPRDPSATVNALLTGRPDGAWTAYVYNGEYLFHPFAETRRLPEALAFCESERRDTVLGFAIDLYPGGPLSDPIDPTDAWLDAATYYAVARPGEEGPKPRQFDFHGGLAWRLGEHLPPEERRIDRPALFRARPGLRLLPDHRLSVEEANTYACPWHHSPTAVIASFRRARALAADPDPRDAVATFRWDGSTRFGWRAEQLMELGLMEPGQWF